LPRFTGVKIRFDPFQYAVMFPALPTGMAKMSGASPSCSQISKAAVCCPSMRYGLIELTKVMGA